MPKKKPRPRHSEPEPTVIRIPARVCPGLLRGQFTVPHEKFPKGAKHRWFGMGDYLIHQPFMPFTNKTPCSTLRDPGTLYRCFCGMVIYDERKTDGTYKPIITAREIEDMGREFGLCD